MKPLCTLLCALAILSFPGVCQAQGATDQQYATELLCRSFGQYFETVTVSRDKGISWKDELDSVAKFLQERPEKVSPQTMAYLAQLMIGNVYYNPRYKHLGPAMNKLTAESRCKQIGAEAFINELQAFLK